MRWACLVAVLALGFAACGDEDPPPKPPVQQYAKAAEKHWKEMAEVSDAWCVTKDDRFVALYNHHRRAYDRYIAAIYEAKLLYGDPIPSPIMAYPYKAPALKPRARECYYW